MDSSQAGLALLDQGDALGALISFTKALTEHPTSPDYYISRAKAFARLSPPRHDLALQDAELAIIFAQQRGSRQKMQEGQLRRVVALYNHGQFMAAQRLLTFSSKWGNAQMFAMWKAKVDQKLKTLPDEDKIEADIEEVPKIPVPSADVARASRNREINGDGSFNFDAAEGKEPVGDTNHKTHDVVVPETTPKPASASIVVRQDWFQTATNITITLFAKGVNKDRFTADIQEDSLHVSFPNPGNLESEYSFSVDPFYALIDAASSKANVLKTKVELILTKSIPNQKWAALEGKEPLNKSKDPIHPSKPNPQPVLQKDTGPSYPTSSKSGAKNWDKVAADLSAKPKKQKKPKDDENGSASEGEDDDAGSDSDGAGDPVDSFFKKLYAGSDPDTQRAMMKSYYESGGTTLSTNWEEVGQKRVEPYKSKDD